MYVLHLFNTNYKLCRPISSGTFRGNFPKMYLFSIKTIEFFKKIAENQQNFWKIFCLSWAFQIRIAKFLNSTVASKRYSKRTALV